MGARMPENRIPAPAVKLTPGRCAWCARFVTANTEPTVWWVIVADRYRQIVGEARNIYARTLCPDCAGVASIMTTGEMSDAWQRHNAMASGSSDPSSTAAEVTL